MKRMPANVRDEAEIAIAGPLVGTLAGVACFALYQHTQVTILLPLAYFSFLLNLLNLIPVSPLDGGRIVGAISRWIWPVGLVAIALAYLSTQNILLLLLLWLGLMQTVTMFRLAPRMKAYYAIPLLTRAYVSVMYFAMAAVLALGMVASQQLMSISGGLPFR